MGGSTGIGNFGRLKTQKVQAFARRSAHLKREGSSRTSITQPDESSFADFDEQESNFERTKIVSGSARHANLNSNSRDEKTSGAHSLNSVLRQYRGDDDLDFPGSEATSGSKGWSNIADVTYGRQNRKQKGP